MLVIDLASSLGDFSEASFEVPELVALKLRSGLGVDPSLDPTAVPVFGAFGELS